ncbi:ATP-binding protein [Bradyrhizobium sp. SZCCHNR3118]|uniref:ATP-binding protein n=1 Tax=Bradyrhizobium sp. SZCCHNR3118 TaxID=3057468 RepID=UPI002916E41C|nr:hypothetical protein [Bradyrhizobium sp. SZCCHNR3118]
MKEHVDVAAGVQDEIAIAFEANAVAFYAQISGLAKDKIGYPIRELATNAWDASRGHFKIFLPTPLNPQFRVRDFGPGMSAETMKNVYARLYASTKRESNNEVGGWGLGSKSPYAYLISDTGSGSYTVTSYHGGMARTYVLSLSASGSPTMRLLVEAPSDEPTGLDVSFPVRREDIHEFHNRARTILWSFNPRPEIEPAINWKEPVVLGQGENWIRYKAGTVPFEGPRVRMGCVMYPFDLRQIKTTGFLDHSDCVLFDAPIGSLKVTLSREELAYDDNTKATLSRLVNEYEQNFISQVQAAVDTATDLIGAVEQFEEQTNSLGVTRVESLRGIVKWQGRFLSPTVPQMNCKTMMLAKNWAVFDKFENATVRTTWAKDAKIVIEHNPSYSLARFNMAQLVGEKILWLRCKRAFREEVLEALGNPEVIELDTFKVPASKRTKSKTVRRRKVFAVTEGGGIVASNEDVEMADGGLYVERVSGGYSRRYRSSSEYFRVATGKGGIQLASFRDIVETAYELGLVEAGTTIVVKNADHADLGEGWTMLGDDLIPDLQAKIDMRVFHGLHQKSMSDMESYIRSLATMDAEIFQRAPEDLLVFKTDLNTLAATLRANSTDDTPSDKAHAALTRLGVNVDLPAVRCPIAEIEQRYEQLCRKYALLKLIVQPSPYYSSTRDEERKMAAHLQAYFDLLHAEQQLTQQRAAEARAQMAFNDNQNDVDEDVDLDEAA